VITANYISKEMMYQNISMKGGWGSNEAALAMSIQIYRKFIYCVRVERSDTCMHYSIRYLNIFLLYT